MSAAETRLTFFHHDATPPLVLDVPRDAEAWRRRLHPRTPGGRIIGMFIEDVYGTTHTITFANVRDFAIEPMEARA